MLVHAFCIRCGYMTIVEITLRGLLARRECTWCGRTCFVPWDEQERAAQEASEERFRELAERHPALRRLQLPGDHVPPPGEVLR